MGQTQRSSRLLRIWLRVCALFLRKEKRGQWIEEWTGEILAARLESGGRAAELSLLTGALSDAIASRRLLSGPETVVANDARGIGPRSFGGLAELRADMRYAVRSLVARPGLTMVAIATLGLGVGSTTGMFSVVNTVLLRPLPYAGAEDIIVLKQTDARDGSIRDGASAANIRDLAGMAETVTHVAGASVYGFTLLDDGRAQSVRGWTVSEGYFEAMGARVLLGRTFLPGEFVAGNDKVVLLSHRTWQSRFNGDPDILGRHLILDGTAHVVVGVLPPEFKHPSSAELWAPRPPQAWDEDVRAGVQMEGVARLADGASMAQAQEELDRIAARLSEVHPVSNANVGFHVVPLREELIGSIRFPLLFLLGSVGLVLLIAAANVAGLQLARGAVRSKEYALRRALGASSSSIVRLVSVESLVLAGGGGLAGVALAYIGLHAVRILAPEGVPRIDEIRIDGTVLGFALLISLGSAIGSGIAPALRASRGGLHGALADSSRGATTGKRASRLRNRLVVIEIAAALVLAIGAGLLVRSFDRLMDTELGFEPANRLAVQVFAYDQDDQPDLASIRHAIAEIDAVPGVESVGLTTALPLADNASIWSLHGLVAVATDGAARSIPGSQPIARIIAVDTGYIASMGLMLREGRNFTMQDNATSPRVALVNEAFARQHFADGNATGQRVTLLGGSSVTRDIVGVLSDVRTEGLESEPVAEIYIPYFQSPGTGGVTFVVKTVTDPAPLITAIEGAVWRTDPGQAIWAVHPMTELVEDWTRQRRFNTALLTSFASLALILACIGVYGLLSFSVARRINELGVRRALGADAPAVLAVVMKQGLVLAVLGTGIGLVAAALLTRMLQGLLFGVPPLDPLTFGVVTAIVMCVALLSAFHPAWRATRIDPATALRGQ
jgi:putative ABC transport system permease protein